MNSMDYGPHWEANGISTSQEKPCIMKPESLSSCLINPAIFTCPKSNYKPQSNFLQPLVTLSLLGPCIFISNLFLNTCSLNGRDQVLHPYKTTGEVTLLYIILCHIWHRNKWFCLYFRILSCDFNLCPQTIRIQAEMKINTITVSYTMPKVY